MGPSGTSPLCGNGDPGLCVHLNIENMITSLQLAPSF